MLKQRLLVASSHSSSHPAVGSLYSFGLNLNGQTAQNLSTGTTNSPISAVDSHTTWKQLSASSSDFHTSNSGGCMGILSNGTLWSWGSNNQGTGAGKGQIAQGNVTANLLVPTQVGSATTWSQVAQCPLGGLAVRADGTMWSWGQDTYGQLGQGGGGTLYYTPTQVGVLTTWSQVFSGSVDNRGVAFFIKTDGTLWVAGRNLGYLTGLGTSSGNTTTITEVSSDPWSMVAVGQFGCLGIQTDGTLWSWGSEQKYELGQGTIGGVFTTPTQVGGDEDWVFVSTGSDLSVAATGTFAIKSNGTLYSCGSNQSYQTGQGINTGETTSLTQVGSASNWSQVYLTCDNASSDAGGVGIRTDGTIWSWGANSLAMTGQGTTTGTTASPTQIGSGASWIRLGATSGCAFTLLIHS